ncbi:transposase domain-containing protein, partial [Paraburkholderia strydomiana]
IGTCKLNEINPRAYLEYVLTHIADHKANRKPTNSMPEVNVKLAPLSDYEALLDDVATEVTA